MGKFVIVATSLSLIVFCGNLSAYGAELNSSSAEVPPQSQLLAPGAAPMPDFASPGVPTPPEEMTSTFIPAPTVVSGAAPADGAWQAFVKQWLDIKKPGYLGNLLSTSQQTDIVDLDAARKKLDDRLSDATARGVFAQPLQDQLTKESSSIAALESKLIASDALSYEEAIDILFRLNMLKASLDAASHGRSKPALSDYFNDKDPISYRDHLLRKLYYFRLNGHLSDSEYDQFRADVNRVSENLTKVGQQFDGVGVLERFKKIDADISIMADDSPAATNAQHFGKRL